MDRENSSKIKAVILDYGEVLCYSPTTEEMGRMAARLVWTRPGSENFGNGPAPL